MIKSEVKAVMKANYRVDKTHCVMKDKMVMTKEDIGKYLQEEWDTKVDEVYKNAALTSDLDGASELAQAGANANELIIPMIE